MWHVGGAGVAGSYLYRRMKDSGFGVSLYDPKRPDYYIPCGFATNRNHISKFLGNVSISIDEILEREAYEITISGNNFSGSNFLPKGLCTIDKMKMEKLMVENDVVNRFIIPQDSGKIIDATGISRYYLGKIDNDVKMYAMEKVCRESPYSDFHFHFFRGGTGYFWSFPLKDRYHIGAGGINLDEVKSYLENYKGERVVSRNIRMMPTIGNISSNNVIGTGESIGFISPLLGEGIVPAMENAELLFQCMKKTEEINELKIIYADSVKKKLLLYGQIGKLVINIQKKRVFNMHNILTIGGAIREVGNFGMKPEIMKILWHFIARRE